MGLEPFPLHAGPVCSRSSVVSSTSSISAITHSLIPAASSCLSAFLQLNILARFPNAPFSQGNHINFPNSLGIPCLWIFLFSIVLVVYLLLTVGKAFQYMLPHSVLSSSKKFLSTLQHCILKSILKDVTLFLKVFKCLAVSFQEEKKLTLEALLSKRHSRLDLSHITVSYFSGFFKFSYVPQSCSIFLEQSSS